MSQNRQILNEIAEQIQKIIDAETAVVALAESEGEVVYYAAAVGKYAELLLDKKAASATSGLCGTAFAGSQPVLVCRAEGDSRVRQDYVKALGIQTALAVPLYYQNQLLGALMALNRNDQGLFDQEAERVLEAYAQQAALLVYQYQKG
jgi:GAF domain-containing protein